MQGKRCHPSLLWLNFETIQAQRLPVTVIMFLKCRSQRRQLKWRIGWLLSTQTHTATLSCLCLDTCCPHKSRFVCQYLAQYGLLAQSQADELTLSQLSGCFHNSMQELMASRQTLEREIERCTSLKGMSEEHLQSEMSRSKDQTFMAKQPSLQAGSEGVSIADDCRVCVPVQQV